MIPSSARVWIAMGHTDMRKGMQGLALLVQQGLKRDPHGGDLYVFRGRAGALVKVIWHDGIGMSLYAKRLEKGLRVAVGEGWHRVADRLAAGLLAGRHRLAKPPIQLAPADRGIGDFLLQMGSIL
jgi:transposase